MESLKSPVMEILITTDNGDAAEKIERLLPENEGLNCARLSDDRIALRSSKGLNTVWSQEDLIRLGCRRSCHLSDELSEQHL